MCINRLLVTLFSNLKSYGDRSFSVCAPKRIMELVTSYIKELYFSLQFQKQVKNVSLYTNT